MWNKCKHYWNSSCNLLLRSEIYMTTLMCPQHIDKHTYLFRCSPWRKPSNTFPPPTGVVNHRAPWADLHHYILLVLIRPLLGGLLTRTTRISQPLRTHDPCARGQSDQALRGDSVTHPQLCRLQLDFIYAQAHPGIPQQALSPSPKSPAFVSQRVPASPTAQS